MKSVVKLSFSKISFDIDIKCNGIVSRCVSCSDILQYIFFTIKHCVKMWFFFVTKRSFFSVNCQPFCRWIDIFILAILLEKSETNKVNLIYSYFDVCYLAFCITQNSSKWRYLFILFIVYQRLIELTQYQLKVFKTVSFMYWNYAQHFPLDQKEGFDPELLYVFFTAQYIYDFNYRNDLFLIITTYL